MSSLLHQLGFPHPPYVLRVLGRTALMWLLLRLLFAVVFPLLGVMRPAAALLLPSLGLPALLVFIDLIRAQEKLLQANLGASGWWLGLPTFGMCLALDAIVLALASAGGTG